MSESKVESGHFFDKRQKQIKQDIMVQLLDTIFENIRKNTDIFNDAQSVSDLIGSILVMFNREIIVHWITTLNMTHIRKDVMKDLFSTIKDQVNNEIKKRIN